MRAAAQRVFEAEKGPWAIGEIVQKRALLAQSREYALVRRAFLAPWPQATGWRRLGLDNDAALVTTGDAVLGADVTVEVFMFRSKLGAGVAEHSTNHRSLRSASSASLSPTYR